MGRLHSSRRKSHYGRERQQNLYDNQWRYCPTILRIYRKAHIQGKTFPVALWKLHWLPERYLIRSGRCEVTRLRLRAAAMVNKIPKFRQHRLRPIKTHRRRPTQPTKPVRTDAIRTALRRSTPRTIQGPVRGSAVGAIPDRGNTGPGIIIYFKLSPRLICNTITQKKEK